MVMRTLMIQLLTCLSVLFIIHLTAAKKCSTCKSFVEDFEKGLKRTKRSNFGGGNTHWEEKSLGNWAHSETRLVDILESVCDDKDCHFLLEKHEEDIEDYWFNVFPEKDTTDDLYTWLCINKIKLCCPENTFGPSCKECPGGKITPCRGNGKCNGEGTRKGTGKCKCDNGYQGDLCDQCTDGYFELVQNDTHTQCQACHPSCQSTCWEAGPKGCDDCKTGWIKDEELGCKDVNECEEESPCEENQYCKNNPGSYTCLGCHAACQGCTDYGATQCKECKVGYRLTDDKLCADIDECKESPGLCNGEKMSCHNTEGSWECRCEEGFILEEPEEGGESQCIPKPKDDSDESGDDTEDKTVDETSDNINEKKEEL